MLNTIWALMILVGIAVGIITGNMEAVGNGALESAGSAVTLCLSMMGIMSMWTGLMQVARASGLLEKMAGWLRPVISFLFPGLSKEPRASEYIATNMVANVLGLGWAATPAGLKAMEELAELECRRGTPGYEPGEGLERVASTEMCTLLVMNMSSLQLIPISMIAYRSQYGSASPAVIVAPVIVATVISTIVAVIFCKIMGRKESVIGKYSRKGEESRKIDSELAVTKEKRK